MEFYANDHLTKHFVLKEFFPNPKYEPEFPLFAVYNLSRVAAKLELIRSKNNDLPITITSGMRNLLQNTECGGADDSYHLQGLAADFACKNLAQVYKFIESNWDSLFIDCSECFYYPNKHIIHLAMKSNFHDSKHVISTNFKK